jgi:ABC-type lipoprotein export system ATPase subunit
MKLNRLYIESFKNLEKLEIDFSKHEGLTLLIGNNGSGKSNLLELLSSIFCNFFDKSDYEADCELQYFNNTGKFINIIIKSTGVMFTVEGVANPDLYDYLPKRVIAIYSGDESRLWENHYSHVYKNYIKDITEDKAIAFPRMLFLNKYYWHISLLCLLCSEAEDVKTFVTTNLGIDISLPITIYFEKNSPKFKNSHIKEFTDSLDDLYDLTDFKNTFGTDPDLFLKLFIAFTDKDNKLISDIIIGFNNDLTQNDLSEGQKKQLLVKAALEFAGQEDTLFLLDEPDAHVHVSNKKVILDIIEPYKVNRHVILTTHSPTLCKYSDKKSIVPLDNGKLIAINDEFDAAKLLVDDNDVFKLLFSTKHILITEGKTDVQYISKAISFFSNEYPELIDLDFLVLGGTDGEVAMELISKIRNIPGRKTIIMVDRDQGGQNCARIVLNDGTISFQTFNYQVLLGRTDQYVLMIPKLPSVNGEFVVEDYFKNNKIKELTKKDIDNKFLSNTRFKQFPTVKDNLKKELLPDFCKNEASAADMEDFKLLLDKIQEIILL